MSSLSLQRAHSFQASSGKLSYLLHQPPGWAEEVRPAVLFLHGAGERGEQIDHVAAHGLPHEIENGKNVPFVAISPQCPRDKTWDHLTGALGELLDDLIVRYKLDERRICLTGMSMGGFGAWKLAATNPYRFAALLPICGGGDPAWAPRLKSLPTWAFHGANDDIVPVSKTQTMVDALQAVGAPVKLTIYPDAGHDSWTRTYQNPEIYDWMLGQRRGSSDASARLDVEHGPSLDR
jgi:predicted peptidase